MHAVAESFARYPFVAESFAAVATIPAASHLSLKFTSGVPSAEIDHRLAAQTAVILRDLEARRLSWFAEYLEMCSTAVLPPGIRKSPMPAWLSSTATGERADNCRGSTLNVRRLRRPDPSATTSRPNSTLLSGKKT
jgi:hypothetical protein